VYQIKFLTFILGLSYTLKLVSSERSNKINANNKEEGWGCGDAGAI
jgi:hypothetical protein